MGRWELTTGWQKDRQTNRWTFKMTDRQTRVITESQTGKMAGRNKVRQDSNMQIRGMKERQTGKPAGRHTIRQDSNRQDRKERL
jgi:hypothetical protein